MKEAPKLLDSFPPVWNSYIKAIISSPRTSQKCRKKTIGNLSGSGALLPPGLKSASFNSFQRCEIGRIGR